MTPLNYRNKTGKSPDLASLQPFRLVKFFSFTSLVMILASALTLSWVISNNAKKVLLERSEAYSLLLAENLNNQVFQQFVIPAVLRYGEIALSNPQQFKRLDSVVRTTTHGFKVDSVTIYDSTQNIISYSTVEELVGMKDKGGIEYEKARKGESNSTLASQGTLLNLLPGSNRITGKLLTYIPFKRETSVGTEPNIIMGVTEVVQDLSDDLEAIIHLQGTIMLTSLIILGGLFAMLRMVVSRGDKIIAARAEERRRLEEKLHDAERLAGLGKMITAVSHEIKNPLGIVRSTAEILEKRIKVLAPESRHLAEIIIEETTRLDNVVMEFLDFARPQQPAFKPTSINDALNKILVFMDPELSKRKITLTRNLDETLPQASIDGSQIHRALLNILINALQAMTEGGTLTVTTDKAPDHPDRVRIRISDTGAGMNEEKREKIFQPFYTDKTRGTGLGLAIAKNIIDSHQGNISVESTEGKGTTFTIELHRNPNSATA